MNEKKVFRVPCTWEVHGFMEIEAEDWDDAGMLAPLAELPDDPTYVAGSFQVDMPTLEDMIEVGMDGVPLGEKNVVFCVSGHHADDPDQKYQDMLACRYHSVPKGYHDHDIWRFEVTQEQLEHSFITGNPILDDDFIVTDYEVLP